MSGRLRSMALAMTCVAAAVALTGGCSSKEEGRYYDDKEDFSIRFPDDWEVVEEFMGTRVFGRSPQSGADDQFQENVNVVVEKVGSVTLEEYDKISMANVARIVTDYRLIDSGPTTLGGEPGRRMVMSHRMGQYSIMASCHFAVKDGRAYVVTCTALEDTYDQFAPKFDDIVKTFRFE